MSAAFGGVVFVDARQSRLTTLNSQLSTLNLPQRLPAPSSKIDINTCNPTCEAAVMSPHARAVRYSVTLGTQQRGPFDRAIIELMLLSGLLAPDARVTRADTGHAVPLRAIVGQAFLDEFSASASAKPARTGYALQKAALAVTLVIAAFTTAGVVYFGLIRETADVRGERRVSTDYRSVPDSLSVDPSTGPLMSALGGSLAPAESKRTFRVPESEVYRLRTKSLAIRMKAMELEVAKAQQQAAREESELGLADLNGGSAAARGEYSERMRRFVAATAELHEQTKAYNALVDEYNAELAGLGREVR